MTGIADLEVGGDYPRLTDRVADGFSPGSVAVTSVVGASNHHNLPIAGPKLAPIRFGFTHPTATTVSVAETKAAKRTGL